MSRRPTIAIVGHVGNRNLGDEAIVAAVVANLRARLPNAAFVAFTMDPEDTAMRHGVRSFPLRRRLSADAAPVGPLGGAVRDGAGRALRRRVERIPVVAGPLRLVWRAARLAGSLSAEALFLVSSFRRLAGVSLVLFAGSQQLSDAVGGPWGFPYTVFKWALLARLRGARVALLSVGAGPIESALSRWFIARAISMACYRSYRDALSLQVLAGSTGEKAGIVTPDLAFSLEPEAEPAPIGDSPGSVVAINPMPFVWRDDTSEDLRGREDRYVAAVAAFAAWLVRRGHRVRFVATQLRMDPPVIDAVLSVLESLPLGRAERARLDRVEIGGLPDLLAALERSDIVVATRFHGAVLACRAGRPVLALAYHEKTRELMARMGERGHAVPIDALELDRLQRTFEDIEARAAALSRSAWRTAGGFRAELARQYDRVAALVPGAPVAVRELAGLAPPA